MIENNYTKCYIAFMDILGFKKMVSNRSFEDILKIYENIKNPIRTAYVGDENNKAREVETMKAVKSKVMSDSICFYVEANLPNSLFCLIMCCASFQAKLVSLPDPVFIRGGITAGEIYVGGDKVFGPGLVEAYQLEEKNAKYPRIIIRKSTLDCGQNGVDELLHNVWSQILFEDFDAFYSLNYYGLLNNFEKSETVYKNLMQTISKQLSEEIDDSIRQKYLYIRKKLKLCCSQGEKPNA